MKLTFVVISTFQLLSGILAEHSRGSSDVSPPWNPTAAGISPATGTRGMVIDAGSGGSRIHVYEWTPRIFDTAPPPISFPDSNEQWTDRISPGLESFAYDSTNLSYYLGTLISSAKETLKEYKSDWANYPIYLRATAGMRQIPIDPREELMAKIRELMLNKTFCPFFFQYDFARVMSGEEEAAFSWSATNFLLNALLPTSPGTGDVIAPSINTFGTVDLGGASTQIAFFVPSQDISDGLFKLQIGSQRHWNIYVKSFLQFGYNSAQLRHSTELVQKAVKAYHSNDIKDINTKHDRALSHQKDPKSLRATDYCLFREYKGTVPNSVVDLGVTYSVYLDGPVDKSKSQFEDCYNSLQSLMLLGSNEFCNFAFHRECSMNGAYQPKLPTGANGHFIGTSTFKYPWQFLEMKPTATLNDFRVKVEWLCSLSYSEMLAFNKKSKTGIQNSQHIVLLPNYCYLSSYILILLQEGYRFTPDMNLTVVDVIGTHKVGWPLGSMLYELNSLPFELSTAVTTSGCSASSIPPASSTHTLVHGDTVPTNDSAANMTHVVATPYNNDVVSALMIGIFSGIIITLCGVWIMQNGSPFSKNRGFSSQSGSSNQLDSSEHLAPRVTRISQFNPFKSNAYQPVPENEGTELIRSTKKGIGDSKNMA